MAVRLDHTIVHSRDKAASAQFYARILGLTVGEPVGRFVPVAMANGINLDFADFLPTVAPQHYAFSVSDQEFDEILGRVKGEGMAIWADPGGGAPGEINTRDGGRGFYFDDPDGHSLEVLTRP